MDAAAGLGLLPSHGRLLGRAAGLYDEMARYSAGDEPRANTADVEPQTGGFEKSYALEE